MTFDASIVPPRTLLPTTLDYHVVIERSEEFAAKSGAGTVWGVTFKVLAPAEHAGYCVFSNFNLVHESQQAQEIGQSQAAALCHALGVNGYTDPGELIGRELLIRVRLRKGRDGYEDTVVPGTYKPLPAVAPAAKASSPPNGQAQAAPSPPRVLQPPRTAAAPTAVPKPQSGTGFDEMPDDIPY